LVQYDLALCPASALIAAWAAKVSGRGSEIVSMRSLGIEPSHTLLSQAGDDLPDAISRARSPSVSRIVGLCAGGLCCAAWLGLVTSSGRRLAFGGQQRDVIGRSSEEQATAGGLDVGLSLPEGQLDPLYGHHRSAVDVGAASGYVARATPAAAPTGWRGSDGALRGSADAIQIDIGRRIVRRDALYCFALMRLDSYEEELIAAQFRRGVSLFACEGWDVFSSDAVVLNPGGASMPVRAKSIGSMNCSIGGPWDLALNTDIFLKAWQYIFDEGRYVDFGWTVKVDPDCVWFPKRFKTQVQYLDPSLEFYINNCEEGLHGPIEVIPIGGMRRLSAGVHSCSNNYQLIEEKTTWGEDVFLRHCFRDLGVTAVNDFNLLSEDACFKEHPENDGCSSGKVAFHPFKSAEHYFDCMESAVRSKVRPTFTS